MLPKPTAVIVDDATLIRHSFAALMPRLEVRGTFANAGAFLKTRVPTDGVVLELQTSDKCPLELREGILALRGLVAAGYAVCIYTQEDRPFVHAACLASGAAGIVSKSAAVTLAQDAFVEVATGGTQLPAELLERFQHLSERGGLGILSPRKRQILAARAAGLSITDIAAQLDEPEALATEEWHITARTLREFLAYASVGMVGRQLALEPEGLADIWPATLTVTAPEPTYHLSRFAVWTGPDT